MRRPNLVIAGERRSGTTTLYRLLAAHPDVAMHRRTDFNYFVEDDLVGQRSWMVGELDQEAWGRRHSLVEYAGQFPPSNGCRILGHKGADLFYWEPAHSRMKSFIPDARFIVMLRHPVDRAWSHYWNEVSKGRESLRFEEAIEVEESRSAESAYARHHLSYLARGRYGDNFERFTSSFPRERVLILILEELQTDTPSSLRSMAQFLELDPTPWGGTRPPHVNANVATLPRTPTPSRLMRYAEAVYSRGAEALVVRATNDPERRRRLRLVAQRPFRRPARAVSMSTATRQHLLAYFDPEIRRLERLLDRPIPSWAT